MELRHLRYFVAVAEEGGFAKAAERRLHTAQPSLSRQIHDLETEVGAPLLTRGAKGVELTAAGRVFLDHARLALMQVEAAGEAARRAARPQSPFFAIGFLTGHEVDWLPESLRLLREGAPGLQITLASQSSPELAGALMRGAVDVAFMRRESPAPGLAFELLINEPLVAVMAAGHRLAKRKTIAASDMTAETFIAPTKAAPVLKAVIDTFAAHAGIELKPAYEAENLAMAMSLVASAGGMTLLPAYAENLLSPALVTRPLSGAAPTIELVLGYSRSNASPLLKRFLARADELREKVVGRSSRRPRSYAKPPPL